MPEKHLNTLAPENLPLPLREGILQLHPPRLLGTECRACGTRTFPPRDFCPACDTDETPAVVQLLPDGRVHSYTVVRQAPAGRPVPYSLALVDLNDGVRILAQLDHPADETSIGMPVTLLLRNVVPPPGQPRLGYAFKALPASATGGAST